MHTAFLQSKFFSVLCSLCHLQLANSLTQKCIEISDAPSIESEVSLQPDRSACIFGRGSNEKCSICLSTDFFSH